VLATAIYNRFCWFGTLGTRAVDVVGLLDAVVGGGVVVSLPIISPQMEYACLGVGDSLGSVVFGCAASLLLIRATLAFNGLLIGLPPLISGYILYTLRLDFIVGRCFFFWRRSNNFPFFHCWRVVLVI